MVTSSSAKSAKFRPRLVVAGATGLVGRAVLALLTGRPVAPGIPKNSGLTALVRQPAQLTGLPAGVNGQLVDLSALGRAGVEGLPALDWAVCCLGTTLKAAGSQAAFRAVDFDAVLAFARAAKVAGASRLAVVSAMGASARSSMFYSRVKGEMEQALIALDLPRLVIVQPALLLGERASLGQASRPGEALAQRWMPRLAGLLPRSLRPIRADAVALAMVTALVADGPAVSRLSSAQLQTLADQAQARTRQ